MRFPELAGRMTVQGSPESCTELGAAYCVGSLMVPLLGLSRTLGGPNPGVMGIPRLTWNLWHKIDVKRGVKQ